MSAGRYRRFARTPSFSIATRPSLWSDEDHLLLVDFNGATENYRRVYWRDVQALVWHETPVRLLLSVCILAFLAAFGGIAYLVRATPVASGVFLFFASVFGIVLAVNLARGPTCACYLQTATAIHRLPAIGRVSQARRLEAMARGKSVLYQSASAVPPPLPGVTPAPEAAPLPPPVPADFGAPPPLPMAERGARPPPLALDGSFLRLHALAFATALLSAVLDAIVAAGWNSMAMAATTMIAGAAMSGLIIVGLVRARRLPDSGGLVRVYWAGLVMVVVFGIVSYGHMMFVMVSAPSARLGAGELDYLQALGRLHGGNSTYMLVVSSACAVAEALIGVLGLLKLRQMLWRWRLLSTAAEGAGP
jgi:hypothetical protein